MRLSTKKSMTIPHSNARVPLRFLKMRQVQVVQAEEHESQDHH